MHKIITNILSWAKKDKEIRALILTGSYAENRESDHLSDYDIAIFCKNFQSFIRDDQWLSTIGKVWVYVPEKIYYKKRKIPTRLVIFENGLKVDFSFHTMDILNDLIHEKNPPDQYNVGYKILLDKDNVAKKLQPPSYEGFKIQKPKEKEFIQLINTFWFEVYHVAKYLKREDLWSVKSRDAGIKDLLLKMIEWNEGAKNNWNHTTHSIGKDMKSWVGKTTWDALFGIFAHFDKEDSWAALLKTVHLFRKLATETAESLKFPYPQEIDKNICSFVLKLRKKLRR